MQTKYQPLVDYIAKQTADAMALSFAEIEAIIGAQLSVSALVRPMIWHSMTEEQVRRWREMGWRARPSQPMRPLHPRYRGVMPR